MRICFWPTTYQADIQACAHHLALNDHNQVVVALSAAAAPLPKNSLTPLAFFGRYVDRDSRHGAAELAGTKFDLLVVDNHLPRQRLAPRVLVLWHGFGWRVDDLSTMRRELCQLVGDVTQPNENFCWQAFGAWDARYRIQHSRLHPSNVAALGSAYSDWLLPSSALAQRFDRASVEKQYSFAPRRKVVLIGCTWHHGRMLGQWGDDAELLRKLVDHIATRGAVTLLRMHDRRRHTRETIRLVEQIASEQPGRVMLKWKDEAPDSWADLCLADVCISNFSSLLNAFYYTGKPSIHVLPHPPDAQASFTFRMFWGMPMRRRLRSVDELWKLPPEQNGGLMATTFAQLLSQIDHALAHPDGCRELAQRFVEQYISGANGGTCQRIERYLNSWVQFDAKPGGRPPKGPNEQSHAP